MADRKKELAQASEQGRNIAEENQKKNEEKENKKQSLAQMNYSDENLKAKLDFIEEYYNPSVFKQVRDFVIDMIPGFIEGGIKSANSIKKGISAANDAAKTEISDITSFANGKPILRNGKVPKSIDDFNSVKNVVENATKNELPMIGYNTNNRYAAEDLAKALKSNDKNIQKINKKALDTIYNTSLLESSIGPTDSNDILKIFQKELKYSEKEANEIIKSFISNNIDNPDFVNLIALKDPITARHVIATSALVKEMALREGLEEAEAELLAKAMLTHDLGKIQIPNSILKTNKRYNDFERKIMDAHSSYGQDILKEYDPYAAKISATHHPTYKGAESFMEFTPDEKLSTVGDIYEALAADYRPYKNSVDHVEIIEKLRKNGYTDLANTLDKMKSEGKIDDIFDEAKKLWESKGYNTLQEADDVLRAEGIKNNIQKQFLDNAKPEIIQNVQNDITASSKPWIGKTIARNMLFGNPSRKEKYKGITAPNEILKAILIENLRPISTLEMLEKSGKITSPSYWISKFSPAYRDKYYQLKDMKQWYDNGLLNEEQKQKIHSLDPDNEDDITNTWKEIINSMPWEKVKYLFDIGY